MANLCRPGSRRAPGDARFRELGIHDPIADRKRIVTYVEIDRCVTDAVAWSRIPPRQARPEISRLGQSGRDILRSANRPRGAYRRKRIFQAGRQGNVSGMVKMKASRKPTRNSPTTILFTRRMGESRNSAARFARLQGPRVVCAECGEGINFKREVNRTAARFAGPAPAKNIIRAV